MISEGEVKRERVGSSFWGHGMVGQEAPPKMGG